MKMKTLLSTFSFLLYSLLIIGCLAEVNETTLDDLFDPCAKIENAFQSAVKEAGGAPACRCLPHGFDGSPAEGHSLVESSSNSNGIWIGCQGSHMPVVFRALNSLNETIEISQMWIWDSLFNVLPNNLFANLHPETLAIENSGVSIFRKGAFGNMKHLKHLRLKNNILKMIESRTFSDLDDLRSLDLSGNKLTGLKRGQFDELRQLETLMLSGNRIQDIEDGTFESLSNVKTLNLAKNHLVNITKNTFRGLVNLEVLNLNGNNIVSVEEDSFSHMKRLQHLDLGANEISQLEIRNLPTLKRLYINRNRVESLQSVVLKDLTSLSLLNADRNKISKVGNNDLVPLSKSPLLSLSLTDNNLTEIGCRAFENIPQLTVLSLQNNRLSSLSCSTSSGSALVQSILHPLQKLRSLFLSRNLIEMVEDGDLNVLPVLKDLSLDHNRVGTIRRNALRGMGNLTSLFLNNNRLYYLPEGIFDSLNVDKMKAVDLSDNPWECVCEREWIGKWLIKLGPANLPSGGTRSLGCLSSGCKATIEFRDAPEDHSFWITVIASVLALVALIFLVTASYVYMQSNCYPPVPLKNLPSDMVRLIPSQESLLSFPNPIATSDLLLKPAPPPLLPISITIKDPNGVDSSSFAANKDKKRVRFEEKE